MSSVLDNISKNDNNFSFISTFFDLVGNKEFKDAEISTLYTKAETSETSIWRSLSAVAEQYGSVFYNNTLNFIDNVTNIDLCKVQQLQSMISWLGVKYTIFNDIQYMPLDIQNLIDIFSVKREYLTSYVKLNNSFVDNMLSGVSLDTYDDATQIFSGNEAALTATKLIDEDEYLSCANAIISSINECRTNYAFVYPELSDFWTNSLSCQSVVDDDKFNSYLSSIYKGVLYSKLCATYNNKMSHLIYEQLSNNILLSDFALPNDIEDQLNSYKLLYNIPATFNVQNEVDKYENGQVELSDYSNQQMSALQMEIDRRKAAYINEELKTRYKFYREREVKEYATFIENEYSIVQQKLYGDNPLSAGGYYAKDIQYDLDPQYIELYNLPAEELASMSKYKLFEKRIDEHTAIEYIVINSNIVDTIANKLVEITNGIREVRETLKMQCQKYFMRGTKLLLNSIVCEYLRSNIVNTLAEVSCLNKNDYVFDNDNNYIDIVEYIDPTNYYNISVESDAVLSDDISAEISALNIPYWKQNGTLNAIGAVDGTNLFVKLPTIDAQNFIFNDATMSTFYNSVLKNKFDTPNTQISTQLGLLKDFLTKLFELGAETTFLSNNVFHTYDSCIAKKIYDDTVDMHNSNIELVNSRYKNVLSIITDSHFSEASTLSSLVDQNQTLEEQLSVMFQYLDGTEYEVQCNDISSLCAILTQINALQENIALSSLSAQLSSKYELINDTKKEAYDYACTTDSYVLQQEYNTLLDNYTAGYQKLSTEFDTIVEAKYIPDDFKQEDLTLTAQLSNLCLCLSAQPVAQQPAGVRAIEDLSTTLNDIGKLDSKIELEIMLETLSSQFEEELGYKQTEIDVLRSSDVFKKRERMFKQYSGTDSADVPFYYMSNVRHPSYMLHPCLSNYVESEEYDYHIDNIANLLNADESKKYMLEHLSNLMDRDGYFINVWQNPLNSNTDYASRYEQTSHRTTSGTENEVIGYDGIFYPSALYDFLNDKTFTEDISKWNLIIKETGSSILSGTFIASLSGCQCYNTQTGLYQHVIWNPWYKHLDLSKNEALFIAKQLQYYRNYINDVATLTSYDISRYGLDAFGNSYILIKKDIREADEDVKLAADGCLWIRIKNHPIAFPAYEFGPDITTVYGTKRTFKPEQQITYIEQSDCNGEAIAFKKFNAFNREIVVPSIQDFTFAVNGNILILNGKMERISASYPVSISASYPVIVNIDQTYNYDANIDRFQYFHNIVNPKNPVYAVIPQSTIENQLSDWIFQTYFHTDNKLGVIYSKIDSSKEDDTNEYSNVISIVGAYYNIVDSTVKQKMLNKTIVGEVTTYESELENVCVDANGNIVTVAYLDSLPNTLVNYLSIDVALDNVSALYGNDTLDPYLSAISIKTHEYEIGSKSFIDIKCKSYAKYTDAGFFGLLQSDSNCLSNNIGDTCIAKYEIPMRGVYKYQILADATPISNMIDYRQVILVRPYEDLYYKEEIEDGETKISAHGVQKMTTPLGTDYYPITYMSSHFYEVLNSSTTNDLSNYDIISSDEDVFDPIKFRDILFGKEPAFKIDEKYIETVKSIENILSDGYPYMCLSVPDIFENPYNLENKLSNVSNGNCLLQMTDAPDFPALSIQWGKYKVDNIEKIKIDFNPLFNSSEDIRYLSANTYNCLKLFLNLDKPGEAGIIDIYDDPLHGSFNKLATYYIKNISDDKPKFLLSANFLQELTYPGFATENDMSVICAEDDYLGKIAFEQKRLNINRSL